MENVAINPAHGRLLESEAEPGPQQFNLFHQHAPEKQPREAAQSTWHRSMVYDAPCGLDRRDSSEI